MRREKKWIPVICVLAAVLVLLAVVALVVSSGREPNGTDQTTGTSKPETQAPDCQTQRPDSQEDVVIKTPFRDLIYPGARSEHLVVEQVSGTEHDVNFYAAFQGEERIFLFSVTFSPETDGALAVMQDANGKDVGVYVHVPDVTAQLRDDQMDEIYSMQEEVNDLLEQLTATP